MSETQKSPTKNVDALRRELRELRGKAREDGMTGAIVDDWTGTGLAPGSRKAVMDAINQEDKSKSAATMLLTLLRRVDKDDTPLVPGTNFTEAGVQRLLRQMQLPKYKTGPAGKIIQRLHTYLTKQAKPGSIQVAGVSIERLRQLAGLLEQIEKHGWEQAKAVLEAQFDIPTKRPKPVIDAEAEPDEDDAPPATAGTQVAGPRSAS
ncbi:MAG: hypothetical protein JSR21_07330 [Proteobacteria bacterium]|nr:hypothetical protein [Pseudomonadota bacterium]